MLTISNGLPVFLARWKKCPAELLKNKPNKESTTVLVIFFIFIPA